LVQILHFHPDELTEKFNLTQQNNIKISRNTAPELYGKSVLHFRCLVSENDRNAMLIGMPIFWPVKDGAS